MEIRAWPPLGIVFIVDMRENNQKQPGKPRLHVASRKAGGGGEGRNKKGREEKGRRREGKRMKRGAEN